MLEMLPVWSVLAVAVLAAGHATVVCWRKERRGDWV